MNRRLIAPLVIAIISGLCAIVAGYDQYVDKQESDKAAKEAIKNAAENQRELKAAQDSLLLEAGKTSRAALKLANVYKQLAEANRKISEISELTYKDLTGGGNAPHLSIQFSGYSELSYYLNFVIFNDGDTNLRGVNITIMDLYSNMDPNTIFYDPVYHTLSSIPTNSEDYEYEKLISLDLPKTYEKQIYNAELPKAITNFKYFVEVKWTTGSYTFFVFGNNTHEDYKFPELKITRHDYVTINKHNLPFPVQYGIIMPLIR